jgi:hypothetical protein
MCRVIARPQKEEVMAKMRIGYALLLIIGVVGVVLGTVPALSQQPMGTVITLKTAPTARVVDLLGSGFSAGDIVLSRGAGDDPETGEKIGHLTVRCQRTKVAADNTWARLLCDGELRTPSGKITFAGTRRQGEDHPTGTFTITGGSADYVAAGGSVSTEDDAARNTWTFEIVDSQ